jgi:hypothetical protein
VRSSTAVAMAWLGEDADLRFGMPRFWQIRS